MPRPLAHPRPLVPALPWRRALQRARRSLALRWALVAVAAALVAVEAAGVDADATARREAWGTSATVAVAVRSLPAGHVVGAGDVVVEARPRAVVPDGALDAAPVGRTLTAAVVGGEVVVASRVAPGGLGAVAARIPDGWRAVAVPTSSGLGPPAPPLDVGDRVDMLAPDVVAEAALVVHVGDDAVTVAVPEADATAVAEAVAVGVVTLALRGASR